MMVHDSRAHAPALISPGLHTPLAGWKRRTTKLLLCGSFLAVLCLGSATTQASMLPLPFEPRNRCDASDEIVPLCSATDPSPLPPHSPLQGVAAWYGHGFAGRLTANGERFSPDALTAAHRHFPFGTKLKVTNLRNSKSIIVRVNDRGPATPGRIIDLSRRGARELGFEKRGTAKVKLEVAR